MTAADKKQFAQLIRVLALAFRVEASKDFYQAYWLGLDDISLDDLAKAVKRGLKESEFMPTVARLRALAGRSANTPPYHRADMLEAEMERTETCTFHSGVRDDVPREDGGVPWCRKCKRLTAAGKQPPPKQLPWGES